MTSRKRAEDAPDPDRLTEGAAGERANPGHGLPGRHSAPGAEDSDPVADFAAGLRELRERAGRPSYRQLAQRAHYSHTALSQAAAGCALPSLAVTEAFVRACGGDAAEWSARWREVDAATRPQGEAVGTSGPAPSGPGPVTRASRWRAAARGLRVKGGAAVAAVAVSVTMVLMWPAGPATLPGQPLRVESSGLYIRNVIVTNLGTRPGYAYVINRGGDKVHVSGRPVRPGHSYTYPFNRSVKDGAQICGYINPGPASCVTVKL